MRPEGNPNLEIYLAEVRRYPVLSIEQQQTVFRFLRSGASLDDLRQDAGFGQYLSTGDEIYNYAFQQSQTLDEFAFRCNLGLVVSEARKFPRLPTLNLIQEGNVGLMRAIQRHDPELGKFTSYARLWIRGSILRAIPDLTRPTHIPYGMRRRLNMLIDIEEELERTSGVRPSEEQLRQEVHVRTGLSERSIKAIFEVMSFGFVLSTSLDRAIAPDSNNDFYSFVPDERVNVEAEALNTLETEELKNGKRPTQKEVAANMGKSIATAQRALRRLIAVGLLPIHPKDRRTVDESGFTEHTRNLDRMIEELLHQDPDLRNKELVGLLADPKRLGKKVSTLTIERSRLRLAALGRDQRRILEPSFYETLDAEVEVRLKTDATYAQIAEDLGQPLRRVKNSGFRLRRLGKTESRAVGQEVRQAVAKYLEEHKGEKINRSAIARQLGITRERVRQIYDDLISQELD